MSEKKNAVEVKAAIEEKKEEFKAMCGSDFDPNEASACFTMCQTDNPEAFAACVQNHKENPAPKKRGTAKKGPSRGKNVWGHLNGCQGALIDDFFLKGNVGKIEKIMEAADATRPRVISHLKHLVSVWKVDLRVNENKEYFVATYAPEGTEGKKTDGVKVLESPEEPKAEESPKKESPKKDEKKETKKEEPKK